jgi:hypothetical protein
MDIVDEETPSQVEHQPEQVPETQQLENEEVAAEQPCFDEKSPVAEAAPEPVPEMDEDLKDGDAVPILDEKAPVSVEDDPEPETAPEIESPQHEAPPVEEPTLDEEPPVTSLPESESFPEMENTTTTGEEASEEPVEPAVEPELEEASVLPDSTPEETTGGVEEGQEVDQPPVEHGTVPEVEHGKLAYKLN